MINYLIAPARDFIVRFYSSKLGRKNLLKLFFLALPLISEAQTIGFKQIVQHSIGNGPILWIAQDKKGYLWYTQLGSGVYRFDGTEEVSFLPDETKKSTTVSGNQTTSVIIDRNNRVLIGYIGTGFDIYDQERKTFTNFRNDPGNPNSLSNDSVLTMLEDSKGNIWIGTFGGVDKFDPVTKSFTHYLYNPSDTTGLSFGEVATIYEDRTGVIWVGCNHPAVGAAEVREPGGLNRIDPVTGKITRFMHDPANDRSLFSNMVTSIFEDRNGKFWIGTYGDGLHSLNRKTGEITRYPYRSDRPDSLSRGPFNYIAGDDHITFIDEDSLGFMWIGNFQGGIQRYDPVNKKIQHYGRTRNAKGQFVIDSSSGLTAFTLYKMYHGRDGQLFITSPDRKIFRVDRPKPSIPFISLGSNDGNAFYVDAKNKILWLATSQGLIKQNLENNSRFTYRYDKSNSNSLASDTIGSLKADAKGVLWMGTNNGICRFDPARNIFETYRPAGEVDNQINMLNFDRNGDIWISYSNIGVRSFDPDSLVFKKRLSYNDNFEKGLISARCYGVAQDSSGKYWVITNNGVSLWDPVSGKYKPYLRGYPGRSIFIDSRNEIWAGTQSGLFRYDRNQDKFVVYVDPIIRKDLGTVLHLMEDPKQQLWVSAVDAIYKISTSRDTVTKYGDSYGVRRSGFDFGDNLFGEDGKIYIGDVKGYYAFNPESLREIDSRPLLNITRMSISNPGIPPERLLELNETLLEHRGMKLAYNENNFSFDFNAFDYESPGDENYMYILENYDDEWRYVGKEKRAYFFNIPAGKYNFRVRAVNGQDQWVEKSIEVVITPPWWKTWWAYTLGVLLFAAGIWRIIVSRSNQLKHANTLLEEKVKIRTEELNRSLQELQSTQSQLVQREKMASLGELTAGIAHEIQNPLNFVNNFSEVNKELIEELKAEILADRKDIAIQIADDLSQNQEKINYHGKRADSIVKSMLQHSRSSDGNKVKTDLNKLADEYLRLAYHGFRAKEKDANINIRSEFDPSIGEVSMVPEDIGRVLLNILNNSFQAVMAKKKKSSAGYIPEVSLVTKKMTRYVEIRISDNGTGIPDEFKEKVLQPFFTTKPTGQGTGLGLSLSYDIISKGHNGNLSFESMKDAGTDFIITIPV